MTFRQWWLRRERRPLVRPWALLTPLVVLTIALPLLRPLRHPDPRMVSDDEQARLATIEAVGRRHSLVIDDSSVRPVTRTVERGGHLYADQPPMLAVLLSGSYWIMGRLGISLQSTPYYAAYLLTILGSTLPVALSAGMVYRMGRLFELTRPWRAALALGSVLATGYISYATVLNAHAPAAALILCSTACLIHLSIVKKRFHGSVWIAMSGACAALAATIDPPAAVFLLAMLPVTMAFRWPILHRLGGGIVYALGAAAPILIHVALVSSIGGDPWAGVLPAGPAWANHTESAEIAASLPLSADEDFSSDGSGLSDPYSFWSRSGEMIGRVFSALVGPHGVLSHFPIIIIGVTGIFMIMHRHWPTSTKTMAAMTLTAAVVLILGRALGTADWRQAMFASRWFVIFLPILFFWTGAWMRRTHRPITWAVVAVLLVFSTGVSLIGATGPTPPTGFRTRAGGEKYTALGALRNFIQPPKLEDPPAVIAGRLGSASGG